MELTDREKAQVFRQRYIKEATKKKGRWSALLGLNILVLGFLYLGFMGFWSSSDSVSISGDRTFVSDSTGVYLDGLTMTNTYTVGSDVVKILDGKTYLNDKQMVTKKEKEAPSSLIFWGIIILSLLLVYAPYISVISASRAYVEEKQLEELREKN